MRLRTRLRLVEARLMPKREPRRFRFILEDEHGVWHDGKGTLIDPATVSGPVRIIRLIKHVPPPSAADLLGEVHTDELVAEEACAE